MHNLFSFSTRWTNTKFIFALDSLRFYFIPSSDSAVLSDLCLFKFLAVQIFIFLVAFDLFYVLFSFISSTSGTDNQKHCVYKHWRKTSDDLNTLQNDRVTSKRQFFSCQVSWKALKFQVLSVDDKEEMLSLGFFMPFDDIFQPEDRITSSGTKRIKKRSEIERRKHKIIFNQHLPFEHLTI